MIIDSFRGEYRFLSNFWFVDVILDGITYRSVEHAYMAAKTTDTEIRKKIASFDTPGEAKKFCKTIKLREDWDDIKLSVMENLLRQKFKNASLKQKLLSTCNYDLVEGNTWGDTFWGVCRGNGKNHLGKLLMKIREELKTGT